MISIQDLSLKAGAFTVNNVFLALKAGEYGVLMGRTGSGKTTILEAIAGLKPTVSGSIRLLDQDVTQLKPADRGVGYVPQDRALFPTMTVREHLAFALKLRKKPAKDIRKRVDELAELLGIEKLLHRKPHGLSGGESQRVALGRALSFYPKILLLDEPLSALDESTRGGMCGLLKRVQHETGVTTLHVTHSLAEAKALADRLFVLKEHKVVEMNPGELKTNPLDDSDMLISELDESESASDNGRYADPETYSEDLPRASR